MHPVTKTSDISSEELAKLAQQVKDESQRIRLLLEWDTTVDIPSLPQFDPGPVEWHIRKPVKIYRPSTGKNSLF